MFAIFRKEMAQFFATATGYFVIGLFLVLTGLLLWVFPGEWNVLDSGYAQVDGLFTLAPWLYLLLVPAVCMRMIAEERRLGTIELLLTKPVTAFSVTLGKYLAGLSLVILSLLPTIVYFFSVWYLAEPIGNVDSGAYWGSMIGLLLLAMVYVALSLFASALSDNQITAFLFAVLLCFTLYAGFDLISSLFASGSVQSVISFFGIAAHYDSMSRGVIDLSDVVYLLSVTILFLFLTSLRLRK